MTSTLAAGWLNGRVWGVEDPESCAFGDNCFLKRFYAKNPSLWTQNHATYTTWMCVGFENREELAENSGGVVWHHRAKWLHWKAGGWMRWLLQTPNVNPQTTLPSRTMDSGVRVGLALSSCMELWCNLFVRRTWTFFYDKSCHQENGKGLTFHCLTRGIFHP